MSDLSRWTITLLVLLLGLSAPSPARAAEPAGAVAVYVFGADGVPVTGLQVRVGEFAYDTDADGIVRASAPAGRPLVVLGRPARLHGWVRVKSVSGQVTEVIARLGAPGMPTRFDVETPGESPAPAGPEADVAKAAGDAEATVFGTLSGTLTSDEDGSPIPDVEIFVIGARVDGVVTGADGTFAARVPVGTYAVMLIHEKYASQTVKGITVAAEEPGTVVRTMTPAAVKFPVLNVDGYGETANVIAEKEQRKDSRTVEEVIGKDSMEQSGAGDAGEATKRTPGITIVGRFVYVRGMGERYSSTLLNAATLPSPEPERRVVPLDLFPTGVLESVKIQKAYTPDLPGEFGGGAILLRTARKPEAFELTFGLGHGFNSRTTFQSGLTYSGGQYDWFGVDDGTRALPSKVENASKGNEIKLQDPISGEGFTLAELEELGESMPNIWSAKKRTLPPDFSVKGSVGDTVELWGNKFGYTLGTSYKNGWKSVEDEVIRTIGGSAGQTTTVVDYRANGTTNAVDLAANLNLSYDLGKDHVLEYTGLVVRTTKQETQFYEGYYASEDTDIRVTTLSWTEEMLATNQFRGTHDLLRWLSMDWQYALSMAFRDAPDYRQTRYDFDATGNQWLLSNRPEGNQRIYNELDDMNHDVALNFTIPFPVGDGVDGGLRLGANFVYRDREAETRRFKFIHRGPDSQDPTVLALPTPEHIFSPEFIDAQGFSFEEITRATDNYSAEQTLIAAYVMFDVPIGAEIDFNAGFRVESSDQEVKTFNLFDPSAAIVADLSTTDILPAVNLTWRFWEQPADAYTQTMQLRGGYSRTLSRPDFRELSEAQSDEVVGSGVRIGNADLERTLIDNFDLRWEWYPGAGESVSVGLFYKLLDAPIEVVELGGSNRVITLDNAKSAVNLGAEFEFRKSLGFLAGDLGWAHPASFMGGVLRDLQVIGNFAYIDSSVEVPLGGIATEEERPLQGQSEYVVNFGLAYVNEDQGLTLSLLYNVFSERIVAIGTRGLSDAYEQPFHSLDFVAKYKLEGGWSAGIKVTNLMDAKKEVEQSGEIINAYRPGIGFSFGFSWAY